MLNKNKEYIYCKARDIIMIYNESVMQYIYKYYTYISSPINYNFIKNAVLYARLTFY